VLLPVIADLQCEHEEAKGAADRMKVRVLGSVAFWRALLSVLPALVAGVLSRWAWRAGDGASSALLLRSVAGWSVVLALVLSVPSIARLRRWTGPVEVLTLLPAMVCLTLPVAAALGAFLLTRRRAASDGWRLPPVAVIGVAAASLVNVGWLTPASNQEHRERIFRAVTGQSTALLSRGDRELSLGTLGSRIAALREEGRWLEVARHELEWHKKLTLSAACVVFAWLGAALARRPRKGWSRAVMAAAAVFGWIGLLTTGEVAADVGRWAPALAAWLPVAFLALTVMLVRLRPGVPVRA
jgi:hypothetical protein